MTIQLFSKKKCFVKWDKDDEATRNEHGHMFRCIYLRFKCYDILSIRRTPYSKIHIERDMYYEYRPKWSKKTGMIEIKN